MTAPAHPKSIGRNAWHWNLAISGLNGGERLMTCAGGNVSRASRKAKLDRMYLHRLLSRYEIKRDASDD